MIRPPRRSTLFPYTTLFRSLGTAATAGRDKIIIVASPAIYDVGAWLEQLIAESTGKQGHGIIPVDREELTAPSGYGGDRDRQDRKSTRLNSSHQIISYAVFC